MSVLIKGMKMPNNCGMCSMAHRNFDGNKTRLACYAVCDWADDSGEGRLHNCPLVEVQEKHGRLIDADRLCVDITETADPIYSDMIEWAIGMVEAQPTVIEEESE